MSVTDLIPVVIERSLEMTTDEISIGFISDAAEVLNTPRLKDTPISVRAQKVLADALDRFDDEGMDLEDLIEYLDISVSRMVYLLDSQGFLTVWGGDNTYAIYKEVC